jgi:GNAT superfamily N-acetyltransferase
MSFDPTLVRRLEELWFNAWPALRTVLVGGWVVRLADGHERRANGASPMHPSFLSSRQVIDLVEEVFLRANVEPGYRLTGLEQPGFEKALRSRGYVEQEDVVVLRSAPLAPYGADADVVIEEDMTEAWLADALTAYGWDAGWDQGMRRVFEDLVWPCGFATIREGGDDVAWGLAVLEADHIGLFDLVVAPDRRGKGYGRRLVRSLLGWGVERGAGRAYLQVRKENEAALGLYASLGFKKIYGCTHFGRTSTAEYTRS